MPEIVIIGGGMAGLGTALALSRAGGYGVTVLERDHAPLPGSPDDAFTSWDRHGAPQVRHSHAFLARIRNLLRDRAPDVLAALMAAGAKEVRFTDPLPPAITDRAPRPGDEDLAALLCRRTTFEWVLRRAVLSQPGVEFRHGTLVTGLTARGTHVTGVLLDDGTELAADLVVDASGPRSALPKWLAGIGTPPVPEQSAKCGIIYYSRFYRLSRGAEPPPGATQPGADLGYLRLSLFPADNGTFSLTYGVPGDDHELRALARPLQFELISRQIPAARPWLEPGRSEPLTGVQAMGGLVNRKRPLVTNGTPVVTGLVSVGDAAVTTNPVYGRGCSLAMAHAYALADTLATTSPASPRDLAVAYDHVTRRDLDPWYTAAVTADKAADDIAHGRPRDTGPGSIFHKGLLAATQVDPDVYRAFRRLTNLLDLPTAIATSPDILTRIANAPAPPTPPPPGPARHELLAALNEGD
jgi:2-polyprenyl-6-methoxyphenol hydroxylase-like FAD-dependent oxidoreductase